MLGKLRDKMDTKVKIDVIVRDLEEMELLREIWRTEVKRGRFGIMKDERYFGIMWFAISFNRYTALMKGLHKRGYNLKALTPTCNINSIIKWDNKNHKERA